MISYFNPLNQSKISTKTALLVYATALVEYYGIGLYYDKYIDIYDSRLYNRYSY